MKGVIVALGGVGFFGTKMSVQLYGRIEVIVVVVSRKIRTRLDFLSIPQSGGGDVKTFRWDQRLQIQKKLFMVFKRVPRWK